MFFMKEKSYVGFVAAKCTECGADIEVDDTKRCGGICSIVGLLLSQKKQ